MDTEVLKIIRNFKLHILCGIDFNNENIKVFYEDLKLFLNKNLNRFQQLHTTDEVYLYGTSIDEVYLYGTSIDDLHFSYNKTGGSVMLDIKMSIKMCNKNVYIPEEDLLEICKWYMNECLNMKCDHIFFSSLPLNILLENRTIKI